MTNEDILEAIEPKRRSNGRVYNGDLKSYGLQLLKTREDLSELIIGKNQDVDFVFFTLYLQEIKRTSESIWKILILILILSIVGTIPTI